MIDQCGDKSELVPDSIVPLCRNSQGVRFSRSRGNFTLECLYDDKLIDSCDLRLSIVVSVMATTAPESAPTMALTTISTIAR